MKTIGLLGGMSWESSLEYYQIINRTVRDRLGGFHSARSILYSVDFAEIEMLQREGRWDDATAMIIDAARSLERGGARFIVICTNTMHKMADEVQRHIGIPLLHIADATAERVKARGIKKVGLLGTRFTMEEDFYKGRLTLNHGLEVLIPSLDQRELIHHVIYHELCAGVINSSSRATIPGHYRNVGLRGSPGNHPGMHRNRSPGQTKGLFGPLVRYDSDPCYRRRGICAGALKDVIRPEDGMFF